jgi:hypothetical protein
MVRPLVGTFLSATSKRSRNGFCESLNPLSLSRGAADATLVNPRQVCSIPRVLCLILKKGAHTTCNRWESRNLQTMSG